jgi:large subunit ribosomal protein L10
MQDNPRPEKAAVVTEVKERLEAADAAILTEYRGLTVGDMATLRRALRAAGGDYKVYKNTLVRFAVQDKGLDELVPLLVGPTAIAFVDGDAVTVAKALRDFARTNPNLVIKGGLLGTGILTAKEATALADIPPRDVLLARLAGGLAAPLQQFAGLLQALPRNLAYGLAALIEKQGGVPEPVAEAAAEAAPGEAPAAEEAAPAAEAAAPPAEEAAAEAPAEPEAEAPAAEPAAETPVVEAPGAEASAAQAAAPESAAPEPEPTTPETSQSDQQESE